MTSAEPTLIHRQRLVALVLRTAVQDREAFRLLYDLTRAKLYGIIVRILPEKDVAIDVLQEVYVRIWQRAGDFDPARASPITWMATITRNLSLDELRRPQTTALPDDDILHSAASDDVHPLDAREHGEELKRLMNCLMALNEERRQMVMLAYYRGLSREALSRRFNRPVPTVKTYLHRSLAQLKECLGDG